MFEMGKETGRWETHRDRDRNREGEKGERGQSSVAAFLHKLSFLNTASIVPF